MTSQRTDADAPPPTIAIVGGGFSGTLTAVHLLRDRVGQPARVVIINRSGAMARGVAYGTQSDRHVLNVAAGDMSAFDDDPEHFLRFVWRTGVAADRGSFVSRRLYGAYLEELLNDAAAHAPELTLERVTGEVLDISLEGDPASALLTFRDGSRLRADLVVFAVGNYPPADLGPALDEFCRTSPRYVPDPWSPGALDRLDPDAPILLVGTGLTMVDVVLERHGRGGRGVATAVSRHGLLPAAHGTAAPSRTAELPTELTAGPHTARAYLRAVRRQVRDAAARGVDWRDVMASLRPMTPRLWQTLTVPQRAAFLRHIRPFWEVHRRRLPAREYQALTALRHDGGLLVHAGRIIRLRDAEGMAKVQVRLRRSGALIELDAAAVVNCTGPTGDTRRLCDPLFASLRARGLLSPDALGLGVDTSPDGALIGRDGHASSSLFYVGPFLKARDWEATAVPELRCHAHRLSRHLVTLLRSRLTQSPLRQ